MQGENISFEFHNKMHNNRKLTWVNMCAIWSRGSLILFNPQYVTTWHRNNKTLFQDILNEESEANRRKLRQHKNKNKKKNQHKNILKDTSISFLGAEYDSEVLYNFQESV